MSGVPGVGSERPSRLMTPAPPLSSQSMEVTQEVGGNGTPQSGNVLVELNNCMQSEDYNMHRIAVKMREKYDKYWGSWENMNMLTYIAVLLDPRNKEEILGYALDDIFGEGIVEKSKFVKDTAVALFNEYKAKYGIIGQEGPSGQASSEGSVMDSNPVIPNARERYMKRRSILGEEAQTELERYLSEAREYESPTFDILHYWKVNSARFPILSKMARDVLAIPISTVASESAFSTGGRVLDPFRSSLTPRIVQSLICTADWLRSIMATQKKTSIEEDLDELEKLDMDLGKIAIEPTVTDL